MNSKNLSQAQIWILAARPKTLPAAMAPVVLGMAIAWHDGVFNFVPAVAALLGALLLQIGANLANDLFDHEKGADTSERLGPIRVTQAGLVTPWQISRVMWVTFTAAALVGIYLAYLGGLPIILIGVLAILSALAYTGGPYPLGYNGLGDIFVFIFFGLVAVAGTYYVQANALSPLAIWSGIPVGFLAVAILVVNNLRDINTDRIAGKRTLAVRFGSKFARWQYTLLYGFSLLVPVLLWFQGLATGWVFLTLLTLPFGLNLVKSVWSDKGVALNQTLANTGKLELLFALLLSVGLLF